MKNFIKYYYDIDIKDYEESNDNIIFDNYEFIKYDGDINKLLSVYSILINYNVYCHEIIPNRDNSILTMYNGDKYILIKKHINDNNYISLNNIYNYDISVKTNKKIDWKTLWEEKLDYYEYQISELGLKYKKLRESFSYYSGLCECAISLLNYVNYNNVRITIAHNRIKYNETIDEFTNPINITIDNITRDIASYIKNNIELDVNFIARLELTSDEYILLMARLLYPSYYFDVYDSIMQGKNSENEIDKIIKKSDQFESLLKRIYLIIKEKANMPSIDWLHYSNNF